MTVQSSEALDVVRGNARHSTEALALDTRRAVRALGMGVDQLADVLDVDDRTADAIVAGHARITPGSELAERALLLVRLHRALGDVHGSVERMHAWLETDEPALSASPRELIRTTAGLQRVVRHIEAHCKDCLLY
ncbi:antitoxin Xre/MbcA/ParS toxin-binding domain-containing protein [Cognatilysobacter segetis]|uniref:antitoxin Xre/MbcA/ParS toxin-binding domain-containing protein n=1 Tax=Cognatilysobacter segetis TaxID=2492394 RepID=UPI00138FFDF2|nr:antitoxin Xre/MbcA/ParS toxin-binding domain-containing protein [Lysobacter segetis]